MARRTVALSGTGASLPQGPKGDTGDPGPPGRDALVSCKPGKAKKGKVKVTCTVRFVSAQHATVRARLSRGHLTYATGRRTLGAGNASVPLHARRALRQGRYTLTLRFPGGARLQRAGERAVAVRTPPGRPRRSRRR